MKFLSLEARGALYNIMLHYFQAGGLPDDDRKVQKIADAPSRKWATILDELKGRDGLFTNEWRHPRWDKVLEGTKDKRQARRKAGIASGAARRAHESRDGGPPPDGYFQDEAPPYSQAEYEDQIAF